MVGQTAQDMHVLLIALGISLVACRMSYVIVSKSMKRKNCETLPSEQRQHASALMEAVGIEQARKFLGLSRHALERAAGGLTVQRGTVAYLTQQLAKRTADGKTP